MKDAKGVNNLNLGKLGFRRARFVAASLILLWRDSCLTVDEDFLGLVYERPQANWLMRVRRRRVECIQR